MPLIFLEYKPLCSEREFTRFWEFISEGQKNDGSIEESRLFKIREGLFLLRSELFIIDYYSFHLVS